MKPPGHLVIYLSGRCNLRCGYCYSRSGAGPIKRRRLLAAIDAFMANGAAGKKVTFLGGEPALHPALLRAAVERARRKGGHALPIQVFTNGTLLGPAAARFLSRRGVRIVLSLDGARGDTDGGRRFRRGGGSVFKAALKNFPGRAKPAVSMVVTPANAARLAENIEALLGAGFKSLAWAPDITARWDRPALAALRRSALKVKASYLKALRLGRAYEIANIYEMLGLAQKGGRLDGCSNIALAPDGFFYPCDKMLGRGTAGLKRFRTGADGSGREAFFRLAAEAGARPSQVMCAVAPWAARRFSSGARAAGALKEQAAVRKIVCRWLKDMAALGLKYPAFRSAHGLGRL